MVLALQSITLLMSQHTALQESLIGGLGSIVYLVDFGPMAGLMLTGITHIKLPGPK